MIISDTIETVRTIYKELFTIRFTHEGFGLPRTSGIFETISIVPDKATQTLFKGFEMDCRVGTDTLLCFLRTKLVAPPAKTPQKPYHPVPAGTKLRFLIKADTRFLRKTYAVATGSKWVYLFSNKTNNVVPVNIFCLNKLVDPYSSAKDYQSGTVVESAGQIFGAIQSVLAVNSIALTNTDFWKAIGATEQVVSNADLELTSTVLPDENCFGVIDIYSSGTTNSSYDLFAAGPGQNLRSPVYTLAFKVKEL